MDCPELTPTSGFVDPLLTDFYQLTMAYGYWKARKHETPAVFDLFFRTNPFRGAFAVFAGVQEVVRFLSAYHFTDEQLGKASRLRDRDGFTQAGVVLLGGGSVALK